MTLFAEPKRQLIVSVKRNVIGAKQSLDCLNQRFRSHLDNYKKAV
jgi:hypothetical protein